MSRRKQIDEIGSALSVAISDGQSLKDEYQEWRDNIPENLEESPVVEKLDAIIEALERLEEVEDIQQEIEGADLPLGFGRD
jgi:uncharacterized Zn finger protein (UPF0148 family)